MKVRNGFVSNSSSSSFVIRGIKMKETELAKILKIEIKEYTEEDEENGDDLYSELDTKFGYSGPVQLESTKNYFDRCEEEGEGEGEVIVGVSIAELEDGSVTELPEKDDAKIKAKIEKKLKTKIDKPLKTYIQFVSNDNY
jgi:hypothetical protein